MARSDFVEGLRDLIRQRGELFLEDAKKMDAVLRDLWPLQRLETNILMTALRERVPQTILQTGIPSELSFARLADGLSGATGLAGHSCRWAVGVWAEALDSPLPSSVVPPAEAMPSIREDQVATPPPASFAPPPPVPISVPPLNPVVTPPVVPVVSVSIPPPTPLAQPAPRLWNSNDALQLWSHELKWALVIDERGIPKGYYPASLDGLKKARTLLSQLKGSGFTDAYYQGRLQELETGLAKITNRTLSFDVRVAATAIAMFALCYGASSYLPHKMLSTLLYCSWFAGGLILYIFTVRQPAWSKRLEQARIQTGWEVVFAALLIPIIAIRRFNRSDM